jgi:hypothetical protein
MRIDRSAIGLIVRGFEDVRDAEPRGYRGDGFGHLERVRLAFDQAGACDQEEIAPAQFCVSDFEGLNDG